MWAFRPEARCPRRPARRESGGWCERRRRGRPAARCCCLESEWAHDPVLVLRHQNRRGTGNERGHTKCASESSHERSSTTSTFAADIVNGTNTEGVNETGFIPTTDLPSTGTLFWRATAIDAASGTTSAPSAVQSFTANKPSQASLIAAKLGVVLWPGQQPPGASGQATLGDNWDIQTLYHVPTGTFFQSPTVEMLRFFDLFDRGFDPQSAIDWMNGHGYPTIAQWYGPPEKAVLGLLYTYLAARNKVTVNGIWDIVLKTE
jgi:hypothetical protein